MTPSEQLNALESFYFQMRKNKWYWIFSIFCRVTLAYAFIVAGVVKIIGERFASGLSPLHPMGAYLEALHHTGYYYTFVGYAQVQAAILLLIPRTITLGALLYLPIIVNIWILSYAVRFEGSMVTSPLMVLANLYILAYHYDQLRYIIPFTRYSKEASLKKPEKYSTKFPFPFFLGVAAMVALVIWAANSGFQTLPRNSLKDCQSQYAHSDQEAAGFAFCECIHRDGNPLDDCLEELEKSKK
ncbi:DoxX family protein [Algoriphagus sp.]|uniref:DoxX family protein n=1 Tax=Algoriphagus sp. TaxID=1872435 RepID=UPI0026388579|nr:DoxX family protein [Algoriphagus sp.]